MLEHFRELQPGEAVLSVICGAEKSQFGEQAHSQLAKLTGLLPVMPLPPRAGEFYGSIPAKLAAASASSDTYQDWKSRIGRSDQTFGTASDN